MKFHRSFNLNNLVIDIMPKLSLLFNSEWLRKAAYFHSWVCYNRNHFDYMLKKNPSYFRGVQAFESTNQFSHNRNPLQESVPTCTTKASTKRERIATDFTKNSPSSLHICVTSGYKEVSKRKQWLGRFCSFLGGLGVRSTFVLQNKYKFIWTLLIVPGIAPQPYVIWGLSLEVISSILTTDSHISRVIFASYAAQLSSCLCLKGGGEEGD